MAEWYLDSKRVTDIVRGTPRSKPKVCERVPIVIDESSTQDLVETQKVVRKRFHELFAAGYVITSFERASGGGAYVFEPSVSGV